MAHACDRSEECLSFKCFDVINQQNASVHRFVGRNNRHALRSSALSALTMSSKFRASCVFCQICGENPAGTELIVATEDLVAIRDIRPVAKHHFLVVSREHIRDAKVLTTEHKPLLQSMVSVAEQVLRDHGADMNDYRLGFHWPPFCFYTHLHLHVFSPTTNLALINRIFFKENTCWFVPPEFVMSRLECS